MSYAMTGLRMTLRSAADRCVTVPPRLRKKIVHSAADVVQADEERAQLGVADDGESRRIGLDALELVEVETERVGHDRLDDVAVAADEVRGLRREPVVPLPNRGHGPVLRFGQGLSAGEPGGARLRLDDLPEVLLGQFLEPAAGPLAVPDFAEPLVGLDAQAVTAGQDRLRG